MCLAGAGWGATGLRFRSPLPVAFIYSLAFERNGGPSPAGSAALRARDPTRMVVTGGPGVRYRSAASEPRTAPTGRTGSRRGNKIKREKRLRRWVRARPRCRKESCGVGAAPRCAQLRGLAPHRRFPQHKAPRSGADRGQTLAEALRERARGRAVSALSSASLFLPISFFSSCCLLNFLLSLFSFTSSGSSSFFCL